MENKEQISVTFEYITDHCETIGDVLKLEEELK